MKVSLIQGQMSINNKSMYHNSYCSNNCGQINSGSDNLTFGRNFTAEQLQKCAEQIKTSHHGSRVCLGVGGVLTPFTSGLGIVFGAGMALKCRTEMFDSLAKILELTNKELNSIKKSITSSFDNNFIGASIEKVGETFNLKTLGNSFVEMAKKLD